MSEIFVGMPVYNGAATITLALDSLIGQRHQNWRLLISDNASTDSTASLAQKYCARDSRITYTRQSRNLGPLANFQLLAAEASAGYFMWAAADDLWHEDYMSACLAKLEADPDSHIAFCNIINIDSYGRCIREYPSFLRFASSNRRANISAFLAESEILGKANLFYSVFRTRFVQKMLSNYPLVDCWGGDMVFVLAALTQSSIKVEDRVLFMKRFCRPSDTLEEIHAINIEDYEKHGFAHCHSEGYVKNCLKVLWGTPYFLLGARIMALRKGRALIT